MAKKPGSTLREDVRKALKDLWPDGVIEMPINDEESWFWDVEPKLRRELARIKTAQLLRELGPGGDPQWYDDSDPQEDPPDEFEQSRTYYSFFIRPTGRAFVFESLVEPMNMGLDDDFDDDSGEEFENPDWTDELDADEANTGDGSHGWCVAVSLLAPFAVVAFCDMVRWHDGEITGPELEPIAEDEHGNTVDLLESFRKAQGEIAFQKLMKVHAGITSILDKHGIAVLPAEEWRKPVKWLRGGEETYLAHPPRTPRVLDALFCRGF